MDFSELTDSLPAWMTARGGESDVVLTSRVRLARNLAGKPFPGWGKRADNQASCAAILERIDGLALAEGGFRFGLDELDKVQRQMLVERHLISREHASRSAGSAVVMSRDLGLSIMINEEDHLRMQAIRPGLAFASSLDELNRIDDHIEEALDIAFDRDLGYLTACPSNLGTGLRASVMMHLPGLVLSGQMEQVVQGMNKLRIAVRGIYGEGTEALGNYYQVSNQTTLGQAEAEIVKRLEGLIRQIVSIERNSRVRLIQDAPGRLLDQVGRSYANLRHAHIMTSKEAMNWLSILRLGSDLGLFQEDVAAVIDALLVEIQPAHLQRSAGEELDPAGRDARRAEILRGRLKNLPEPDMSNVDIGRLLKNCRKKSDNDE